MLPSEKHIVTFDFGVAELHQNYMLMVMNEGITVNSSINAQLTDLAAEHFKERPFGYITYRKNSYSVDPNVYNETSKIKMLVAFAIVSDEDIRRTTAKVEEIFLDKPLKVFKKLKDAVVWVEKIVALS
ncbi:MAG: hypothetical protein HKP11_08045 [Flavobacteriaceae bacterium]|nr:hypothetical protein [Flavobacteriaceae bacterium]